MFNLPVQFTDTSINDPASWNWSFGDGVVSSAQNNTHTYTTGGNYTVNLTVTNNGGSNSAYNFITVYNTTTSTWSGTPVTGIVPVTTTFTDTSSNGSVYYWSFGDGNTSSTKSPEFTYNIPGNYSINHSVSNGQVGSNLSVSWTNQSYYINVSPMVATASGTSTSGIFPLSVIFTGSSTGSPNIYWWNFGDGNFTGNTTQNPVHVYSSSGIYTVNFSATNTSSGYTAFNNLTNYITVENSTVSGFTGTPISGNAPLLVTFNVTIPNDNATSWNWSFGDGNYAATQNITHTYSTHGIYTVIENASNAVTSSNSTQLNYITVHNTTPVANFTSNVTSGLFSLPVQFTDNSTGGAVIIWNWSFGDGTFSSIQNPQHLFTTGGNYSVNETVYNTEEVSSITKYITVFNSTTSGFTATPVTGNAPLPVQFTDQSSNATAWYWIFGDGGTSTLQSPSYTYYSTGTYTVNHSSSNGVYTSWTNISNYIFTTLSAPNASFNENPTSGLFPLTVQFTDTSSGTVTSWAWTFGDGGTSTLQNPSHIYQYGGTYSITEEASNIYGSSYAYGSVTVYNTTTSGFFAVPTYGVVPLTVSFTDQSSNATNWNWIFGDSGTSTTKNPSYTYTTIGTYSVDHNAYNPHYSSWTNISNYITVYPSLLNNSMLSFVDSSLTISNLNPKTLTLKMDNSGNVSFVKGSITFNASQWQVTSILANTSTYSDNILTSNSVDNVNGIISFNTSRNGGNYNQNEVNVLDIIVSYNTYTNPIGFTEWGITNTTSSFFNATTNGINYFETTNNASTVGNWNIMVAFTGKPKIVGINQVVSFTDASSGKPTAWNWSFGDGNYSISKNPVHIYDTLGMYTINLTASLNKNVSVNNTTSMYQYISVVSNPPAMTSSQPQKEFPLALVIGGIAIGFLLAIALIHRWYTS